jgi:tetratricopeptide (TPR) repeat protein
MDRTPSRLTIWPKRLVYLAYAVPALYAGYSRGLRWVQTALLLIPILLLEGLLQLLVSRRLPRFERELLSLIQRGAQRGDLLSFVRQQTLLRFAAPRYYLAGKLGMVYRHLKEPAAAAQAFRDALDEAPTAKRLSFAMGLAESLYETGEDREAEGLYRSFLTEEQPPGQGRGHANLARLILKRGGDPEEAEAQLKCAVDAECGGALRCELVHLLLFRGKLEEATGQLGLAAEEMSAASAAEAEDSDTLQAARRAVEAARRLSDHTETESSGAESS